MNPENLKRIRKFKDFSRKKLSKASGVNSVTIWQIETGRTVPKVETVEKLAKALDVDIGLFFGEVINFSYQQQKEGA